MTTEISPDQATSFYKSVLSWYDEVGRKDLPWQQSKTAYRVWLSEIMLQQTQVKTVIPYYLKFLDEFPTVSELAAAPIDHVLHLWSGLGYYARARNLHRCAQIVCLEHQGAFPIGVEALSELPGIGRSTAGAIASIAQGQHAAILDGNVKRVLCRVFAVEGHPSIRATEKLLWTLAEATTPASRCADYTQAIMDLGATTCSRSKPDCERCPVKTHCIAKQQQTQTNYPNKKVKKVTPTRVSYPLLLQRPDGSVWLEKRPPTGIWGGLHCFPEVADPSELESYSALILQPPNAKELSTIEHAFSHFKLHMKPLLVSISDASHVAETSGVWYHPAFPAQVGIARPVERILSMLFSEAPLIK
ncbi:A/G-specific adenine glycosylase [Umboniibacter marinipuniceus]|uniref:Adenine DNA glycosylase n=1 Tax=Umboniibacter marinipuniceus TaxID=569599 RepID=A0A3M0A654_9GAMM|nr:A/G-specific adenine glycosylase [Umboniibacter marinipuniceus]RMA80270.1 A/G-specific DNA-adenine glycosylase [Umboniibacter marinipuniceus]